MKSRIKRIEAKLLAQPSPQQDPYIFDHGPQVVWGGGYDHANVLKSLAYNTDPAPPAQPAAGAV